MIYFTINITVVVIIRKFAVVFHISEHEFVYIYLHMPLDTLLLHGAFHLHIHC